MKALKLIILFVVMGLSAACTTEDIVDSSNSNQSTEEGTYISITPDNLLPINMNSRAAVDGLLYKVNDINIKITAENKIVYVYCEGEKLYLDGSVVDHTSTNTCYINKKNLANGNDVFVHVNDVVSNKVTSIEAIANYGSDLYNNKDWNTIEEEGNAKLENGLCIMYGKTIKPSKNDNQHGGQGSLHCDVYEVALQRTRAMFTVSLNGVGLKQGVSITPKSMKVCNIPSSCWVTKDNAIDGKNIKKATDVTYTAAELKWDGSVTQSKSVGVHAKSDDASLPNGFVPIYMYENKQGITENTDKKTKYPQGCTSIDDAKSNQTHSYIEIEADYKYEENGSLKNSGTVIYRFFLGGNDRNDFNMQRNCYYRLTLNLKGFGGAAEDGKVENGKLVVNDTDASWRVDMNIRDWGFEKDEYDFDAHGTLGIMKVMGSEWKVKGEGTSGGNSFIKFWSGDIMDNYWVEPTSVGKCGTEDGILYFYIQPWAWDGSGSDGFNDAELMDKSNSSRRKITITLSNGSDEQTVTFYQWKPITIVNGEIYMERFEEDNPFEWGYQGESISGINNSTLTRKQMWDAIENMPNSPAQIYCKEKGSYSSIDSSKKDEYGLTGDQYNKYPSPSGNDAQYCLPDMNTLLLMQKYCEDHPHSNNRDDENYYQPLELSEGYWSVSTTNNQETYFLDANGQQSVTSARSSAKRVRAIYTVNPW